MTERDNDQESLSQSFEAFKTDGLHELLAEISPIRDLANRAELQITGHRFRQPRLTEQQCLEEKTTYAAPLVIGTLLLVNKTGETKEQEVILGDFPMMTPRGTFIVDGIERSPIVNASEIIETQLRTGLEDLVQITSDRMSQIDNPDIAVPAALISRDPFADAIRRFLQETTHNQ